MAIGRELFDKLMFDYGFLEETTRDTLWKYTNVSQCKDEIALRLKITEWVINERKLLKNLFKDTKEDFDDN